MVIVKKLSMIIAGALVPTVIAGALVFTFSFGPEAAYAQGENLHSIPHEKKLLDFQLVPPDASDLELFWLYGDKYTVIASGEQTDDKFALCMFEIPPQGGPVAHIHGQEAESFYILEGELTVQMEDQLRVATPGTFVYLPRGRVHAFRNLGTTTVKTLSIATPAGLEKAFAAAALPVTDKSASPPSMTPADLKKAAEISLNYGLQPLPPSHPLANLLPPKNPN